MQNNTLDVIDQLSRELIYLAFYMYGELDNSSLVPEQKDVVITLMEKLTQKLKE